ncbi:MAG: hypothetical protein OEW48_12650 [Phycisphaerae bacterium]|nr:hypothetical protein [Phycisphaerae bacterium]
MAQLHNIIGAILRDIAQSRVTSDLFSRKVSQYYEQDSLLRLFPVPRSEIRSVELELKFCISEIAIDPDRNEERDAKISQIFERYSESITEEILLKLRGSSTIQQIAEWIDLINSLDTLQMRNDIKIKLLSFFEEKSSTFLTVTSENDSINIEFNEEIVKDGIAEIINTLIYSRADIQSLTAKYSDKRLLTSVKTYVTNGCREQIESMNKELEFLEFAQEFKVEVDITSDKIQAMPETAISSIKIISDIKNYTWSQVEEKDGKIIRRLVPE